MKILLILLSFYSAMELSAQTIISSQDCGLTYIYDNAGNRICRLVVQCGTPNGKMENGTGSSVTEVSEQQKDSVSEISGDVLLEAEISWVYPNPTQGEFKIVFNKYQRKALVSIIDNNGSEIFNSKINGYDAKFDMSNFASGTYWVRVTNKNRNSTKKLIKQ